MKEEESIAACKKLSGRRAKDIILTGIVWEGPCTAASWDEGGRADPKTWSREPEERATSEKGDFRPRAR